MEIPTFIEDEDKYKINPMKMLMMVKEFGTCPFWDNFCLIGGASKWWKTLNEDTRLYATWKTFEEIFSTKWIRDTKIEAMYKIQDELKELK